MYTVKTIQEVVKLSPEQWMQFYFKILIRPFSFRILLLSDLSVFKFHLSSRIISWWRLSQTKSAQYFKAVDLRIFLSYLYLYYESQSAFWKRKPEHAWRCTCICKQKSRINYCLQYVIYCVSYRKPYAIIHFHSSYHNRKRIK